MNNSNIFKEIKKYLSPQQVAKYYLQDKGKRSGNNVFYKSPFRNEKTASFCVNNEKGFHDYGDGCMEILLVLYKNFIIYHQ